MIRIVQHAVTIARQRQAEKIAFRRAGLRRRIEALVAAIDLMGAAGQARTPQHAKLVKALETTLRMAERLLSPEERARMADRALDGLPLPRSEALRLERLREPRPLGRRSPTTPNRTPTAATMAERPAAGRTR